MTDSERPLEPSGEEGKIEMPAPSAAPLVLSLGITLVAAGAAMSPAFAVVGVALIVAGLARWIAQLRPGRGHIFVRAGEEGFQPRPVSPTAFPVQTLKPGMAGYRMRLPETVHPISAGIRGGIAGGICMTVPALAYGILSGHGIWFPGNLLAGTLLPGVNRMTLDELESFQPLMLVLAVAIHAVSSVNVGLLYGVILPTLPDVRGGPILWGGVVMPLMWTGASYGLMGVVNPVLEERVDWTWFVVSQIVFGLVASTVVRRSERIYIAPLGGHPPQLPESRQRTNEERP